MRFRVTALLLPLTFLVAAALLLIVLALPALRAKREEALQE